MKILKIIITSILCSLPCVYSENCSIVFVHLGKVLPEHVKYALHQARLFNAETSIYLIINKTAHVELIDKAIIERNLIKVIHCEQLKLTDSHKKFLLESTLNNTFREGFWQKATERFFCIEELMVDYGLQDVFHLENDNLLYVNLDNLLPIFKTYYQMAAVFDNDNRCIPSFMYIKNAKSIENLNNFFSQNAHLGLNDMQIPAIYQKQKGRHALDCLPIIPQSYYQNNNLQNALGQTVEDSSVYFNNFNMFNSIFDGAALGQFLDGIDPRNGNIGKGFINESCIFNPSYFDFQWIIDKEKRLIPHIVYLNEKYRINNLHVHSKNLKKFISLEMPQ